MQNADSKGARRGRANSIQTFVAIAAVPPLKGYHDASSIVRRVGDHGVVRGLEGVLGFVVQHGLRGSVQVAGHPSH